MVRALALFNATRFAAANVGERRTWSDGNEYEKQADGSWAQAAGGGKADPSMEPGFWDEPDETMQPGYWDQVDVEPEDEDTGFGELEVGDPFIMDDPNVAASYEPGFWDEAAGDMDQDPFDGIGDDDIDNGFAPIDDPFAEDINDPGTWAQSEDPVDPNEDGIDLSGMDLDGGSADPMREDLFGLNDPFAAEEMDDDQYLQAWRDMLTQAEGKGLSPADAQRVADTRFPSRR